MTATGTTNPNTQIATNEVSAPITNSQTPLPLDPVYQLTPQSTPLQNSQAAQSPVRAQSKPKRRRFRPLFAAILLLFVVSTAVWWLMTSGWEPPWVQQPGPLIASGTLEADEIMIGAEVAGRIIELVQEGQTVAADDVIAKLDDSLVQVQIRQANTAQLQQLEITLDRYQLRSPITGVITRVPMHAGEVIAPGQTAAAVANLDELRLTAYVLERDLGHVQVGQQVTVTVDPFPDRVFQGVVTSTNPRAEFTPRNIQTQADRLNLVFGVQVRVDNPDRALKPGMPADVAFPN